MDSEDCEALGAWRERARQRQDEFYHTHGDGTWWSGHPTTEQSRLELHVASLLLGPPQGHEDSPIPGYSTSATRNIRYLIRKIQTKFQDEVSIGVILICAKKQSDDMILKYIFRIWNSEKQIYIDCSNRSYTAWSAYLKENSLPQCYFCYPSNGRYHLDEDGALKLEFATSSAHSFLSRCLKMCDIFFVLVALSGLVIGIVSQSLDGRISRKTESVLSIMAVTFIAAAGLYNLARCLYVSHDIFKH